MPVIDASIVVDWVAPDSDPLGAAGRLLDHLAEAEAALVAPRLLLEEVSNALLTGCRRTRWTGAAADRAFAALKTLPVSFLDDAGTLDRAWELSRRFDNHPVYDMVYVALAQQVGEQLYTADDRLLDRLSGLAFVKGPRDFAPE